MLKPTILVYSVIRNEANYIDRYYDQLKQMVKSFHLSMRTTLPMVPQDLSGTRIGHSLRTSLLYLKNL
jgi:hypothetical protein